MRRRLALPLLLLFGLFGCTCDSATSATAGSGDTGPGFGLACGAAGRCGAACSTDTDCGDALYCGADDRCHADCTMTASDLCGFNWTCAAHGRCTPVDPPDAGCPRVEVSLTPQVPTVLLLIDQSSSMTTLFANGVSRWDAVKSALTDPATGVLPPLQDKIRFGATLYTSHGGSAGGTCPELTEKPPALDNGAAIQALLDASSPQSDTPTGESIAAVVPELKALPPPPGGNPGPTIIVLATDGEPDSCAIPNPANDQEQQQTNALAVTAASDAFSQGIETFILSVGTQISQAHLQDMANAGTGVPTGGPNAPFYTAASPADLVAAFTAIVGGTRSCSFALSGAVELQAGPFGIVTLNGQQLTYAGADGWTLLDQSTLELTGKACDDFKQAATVALSASFPCGVAIQ